MRHLTFLISLAVALHAASGAAALKEVVPPDAVRAALAKNPKALVGARFFEGPGNLIGAVLFPEPTAPSVLYVSPDGRAIVIGQVVGVPDGRNLTAEAVLQFAPGTPLAKEAEKLIKSAQATVSQPDSADPVPTVEATPATLAKLAYIETGAGERLIYAFVDPRCKHCQKAYEDIAAWQKAGGKTRVRWVPVSLGNEQSTTLAAQALAERSPKSLEAMFKGGGIVSKERLAKGSSALDGNIEFIQTALPIHATPVFVYTDGGKVVAKTGFAGITGFSRREP
jgi:protein-disulfide isomerase